MKGKSYIVVENIVSKNNIDLNGWRSYNKMRLLVVKTKISK